MAVTKKSWVIRIIGLTLALFVMAGGHLVRARLGLHTRPWQLEAYLESRLADCRTGPGLIYFGRECEQLAARSEEAHRALFDADQKWAFWRDYSTCIPKLLSVCVDAQLLRLKLALRQQEQKTKLEILLATLRHELGTTDQNGRRPQKFRIQSIEQGRARSYADQAEYLRSQREVESALEMTLRAWVSWKSFNHLVDVKFARFEDPGLREKWDQQALGLLRWTGEKGRRAILIDKFEHRCLLLSGGQVEKSYSANLSRNWWAQKLQEHDAATPEGKYRVIRMIAAGKYGMALLLDYPNASDRERFAAHKREGTVYSSARMGGSVEIHGAGRPDSDWTDGCISLSNNEMRDLYRRAYAGMPVVIVGTSKLTSIQRDE